MRQFIPLIVQEQLKETVQVLDLITMMIVVVIHMMIVVFVLQLDLQFHHIMVEYMNQTVNPLQIILIHRVHVLKMLLLH